MVDFELFPFQEKLIDRDILNSSVNNNSHKLFIVKRPQIVEQTIFLG